VYKLLRRDEAQSSALRQLYEYWDGKRAGRTLPLKAAIDPADGPRAAYEWGMFPLSDDGERVTHCLAIEDHRGLQRTALLHRPDWVHSSMPDATKPRPGGGER
jgi:hypothetical protein